MHENAQEKPRTVSRSIAVVVTLKSVSYIRMTPDTEQRFWQLALLEPSVAEPSGPGGEIHSRS
jgi:hypothetical protein